MAVPTWRNVAGIDFNDAIRATALANQSFQSGFNTLQGMLDERAKLEQANWEQQKKNNTDELKNLLFNAKTPEEAAAIQSQIAERLTAMGAQVDANVVRSAVDARVPELQRRALETIDYTNKQTDAKDEPILNRLIALALQDPVQAAAELNGAGLSNRGRLAFEQNLRKITGENVANDRATTEFNNKQLMAPLERRAKEAAIDASRASTAASRADTGYKTALTNKVKHESDSENLINKAIEARRKERLAQSEYSVGTLENKEGFDYLQEVISKTVPKEQQQEAYATLQKLSHLDMGKDENGNPIRVPVPAVTLARIITNTKGDGSNWNPGNWGQGSFSDRIIENFQKELVNPETMNRGQLNRIRDGYALYTKANPELVNAVFDSYTKQEKKENKPDIPKPSQEKNTPAPAAAIPQALQPAVTPENPSLSKGMAAIYGTGDKQPKAKDVPGLDAARFRESMGLPLTEEQRRLLRQYGSK